MFSVNPIAAAESTSCRPKTSLICSTVQCIVGETSVRRHICLSVPAEGESGVMRGIRSLNSLPKRCYAAVRRSEALTEPLAGLKPSSAAAPPPKMSRCRSSQTVGDSITGELLPLSSVGVFVKAGSRYETVENQGVSHVLRLAANLVT
ncbi:hypothetical protein INR49_016026 [Caranx melampygus]|nr:hypothetical protein INR49_016026 [Caranx melampygus]